MPSALIKNVCFIPLVALSYAPRPFTNPPLELTQTLASRLELKKDADLCSVLFREPNRHEPVRI